LTPRSAARLETTGIVGGVQVRQQHRGGGSTSNEQLGRTRIRELVLRGSDELVLRGSHDSWGPSDEHGRRRLAEHGRNLSAAQAATD